MNETDDEQAQSVVLLSQASGNPLNYPTESEVPLFLFSLYSMDATRRADEAGYSCSGAFDINGDGFSDFIIGAPSGGTVGEFDGKAYVVFGQVWENSAFRERT